MRPLVFTAILLLPPLPRAGQAAAAALEALLTAPHTLEGVDIHVCAVYAAWNRPRQKDFLDFVDVAARGSVQRADYLEPGFAHLRLVSPHATD